jgi:hypothetical protein
VASPTFLLFLFLLLVPYSALVVADGIVYWDCYENISFDNSPWNPQMTILFSLPTDMQCSHLFWLLGLIFLLVEAELGLKGSSVLFHVCFLM